jgi:hypothetical protein
MATGTLWYWNGESGWIKQSGVENLTTAYARDVMLLRDEVVSGNPFEGCSIDFTVDANDDPWLARSVTAS